MRTELRLIGPSDRTTETQQTTGMLREMAVASERIWSGYVHAMPGMSSGWHHHGDYETVIYMLKGRARFEFGPGGNTAVMAQEDDFIHVPPGVIHRETNPGDTDALFVITRAGKGEPVVNVDGPSG